MKNAPENKLSAQQAARLAEYREQTTIRLRRNVTYGSLALFAINVVCVLAMIFFVGFGKMVLSDKLIFTLIGQSVAHTAGVFFGINRFLFPRFRSE